MARALNPIVGADFNVHNELLGDELTHLTVLAANNTGYQNLTLLISKAYQRGYGAAGPIIERDWLVELKEGLILISGGRMGRRRPLSATRQPGAGGGVRCFL
ncbi:DNA polymerase III subunit alpha [Salmonella enterica subsp. enterica]|nr:DNA polymerase III subunit alpha [Salmonella enterica subsp. enterica]